MKIIEIEQLYGTKREVDGVGFKSLRAILAKDGMGFSMHKTIIQKGGPYHWHYQNHLEACYCVAGSGTLTNLKTSQKWEIIPDMVYVLDEHDDHTFEADETTVLISVFNPPVVGDEIHDEEGNYKSLNNHHYTNDLWD